MAERTAELGRSEAYLAEAQRLTHTGSFAIDVSTREVTHSSDEHSRLYGFDARDRVTPSRALSRSLGPSVHKIAARGAPAPLDARRDPTVIGKDGHPKSANSGCRRPHAGAGRELGIRSAVGCPIAVRGGSGGRSALRDSSERCRPRPRHAWPSRRRWRRRDRQRRGRAELERLAEEQAALRRVAMLVAEGAAPTAVLDAVAAESGALVGGRRVTR